MRQKTGLAFLLTCFIFLPAIAQENSTCYLLTPDTTVVTRIFPSIGWDTRLSFINNEKVAFKGVRLGVRFGKHRNRLTAGYRWFTFVDNVGLLNYDNISRPINSRYFNEIAGFYYTISYQHILFETYRFAFGGIADIGWGATYDDELSYGQNINIFKRKNRFVPLQFGLYSEFKATRFAGITAQIGYRWVENYQMQPSINKLYLGVGARLYLGSVYRHFKS